MIFHSVDIRYYTLSKYVGILGELGWLLKMGLIMILEKTCQYYRNFRAFKI
jgi:hypothetical protein